MIKIFSIAIAGLFFTAHCNGQHYTESSTDLTGVPGYKQKKIGTTLTIGGAILLIGGVAMLSQADEYYYNSTTTNGTTTTSGDLSGGLGSVMVAGGLGMTIPGIILWSKGAKKLKAYKEEHHISMVPKGYGLSLRFNF